jgi:hypothetical protein
MEKLFGAYRELKDAGLGSKWLSEFFSLTSAHGSTGSGWINRTDIKGFRTGPSAIRVFARKRTTLLSIRG